jgi:hypothetical protein
MDRLGRLRERMDRSEKRLREKPRRGQYRERLTQAWISASDDFEGFFATEAMRRFGYLL